MIDNNSRLLFLENQWNNAVSKLPPEKALEVLEREIAQVRSSSGIDSSSIEQKVYTLISMGIDYPTALAIANGKINFQSEASKSTRVDPDQELKAMLLASRSTSTTRYPEAIPPTIAAQWQAIPQAVPVPAPHYIDNSSEAKERGWAVVTGSVVACLILSIWFTVKPSTGLPDVTRSFVFENSQSSSKPPPTKLERAARFGDRIGKFSVSSGFGWRIHPIYKTRMFHGGVDTPIPYGFTLLMPGRKGTSGSVKCWGGEGLNSSSAGGGFVATITSNDPRYKNMKLLAMHLKPNSCIAGNHAAGEKIAEGGNSGASTGPHLHLTQKVNGKTIPPSLTPIKEILGIYNAN
ncbi:M23 family metallopeptidase (plasmid) [Nostoc sp. C052]|uniref:M23 family metallopeptidase n=1 Tax=Nostoc sp. C052 TaxID=2576902 RepID=UPI0015C2DE9F|nr:M23 family metallopeptidase [Nostoc sp. C052]QLE46517.1 M23 family metallopeptidase [Nostoc sp. C052]